MRNKQMPIGHIMDKQSDTRFRRKELLFILVMLVIAILISGYGLKLLHTGILIDKMVKTKINYEAFRELQINEEALYKAKAHVKHLTLHNPELKDLIFIDDIGYITFSMMARDYNLLDHSVVNEQTFLNGLGKVAATSTFQELYGYYKAIFTDLKYFPVPRLEEADINYSDSWFAPRTYGGNRNHEGTDLMASNNQRDYFPILSMTDGIVEKKGWLEQGGWRIGVRAPSGGYFYYAHLSSYAPDLKEGDYVIAGQLLGFMGDSGYGSEGTIGQFDVHLHLGIYVNSAEGELSVNPFYILKILEKNRLKYYK